MDREAVQLAFSQTKANDEVLERIYTDRLEKLFELYTKMTS
jgi:hypothetical protein